jgi:hypothetical protein
MEPEFVGELLERAANQPDCAIRMAAGTPAVDLTQPADQRAGIGGAAVGQLLHLARDGVQAEQARPALAG